MNFSCHHHCKVCRLWVLRTAILFSSLWPLPSLPAVFDSFGAVHNAPTWMPRLSARVPLPFVPVPSASKLVILYLGKLAHAYISHTRGPWTRSTPCRASFVVDQHHFIIRLTTWIDGVLTKYWTEQITPPCGRPSTPNTTDRLCPQVSVQVLFDRQGQPWKPRTVPRTAPESRQSANLG